MKEFLKLDLPVLVPYTKLLQSLCGNNMKNLKLDKAELTLHNQMVLRSQSPTKGKRQKTPKAFVTLKILNTCELNCNKVQTNLLSLQHSIPKWEDPYHSCFTQEKNFPSLQKDIIYCSFYISFKYSSDKQEKNDMIGE